MCKRCNPFYATGPFLYTPLPPPPQKNQIIKPLFFMFSVATVGQCSTLAKDIKGLVTMTISIKCYYSYDKPLKKALYSGTYPVEEKLSNGGGESISKY